MYEKVIDESDEEELIMKKEVKPKNKEIIKYVEESSDSEEEIIVKRKTKKYLEQLSKQGLTQKLNNEQSKDASSFTLLKIII